MVMLRCKYCGAPLDRKALESDSPYITCSSCGTSQQRMDAKAYLDQMMGQIQSWISKTIPGGFSLAQSENVDSVARFNIFNNSVRPRIETEYSEYRFATNSLLANPLITLPFTTDSSAVPVHSSAKAFEFNARVKSIEALAVDESSKDIIVSAEEMASGYAMLINNTKLLHEDKPGRYILLANNFAEASAAFRKIKGYGPAADRFQALSGICTGCEKLLNGDSMGSLQYFENGYAQLGKVKAAIGADLTLGIMYQAVEMEMTQAKILSDLAGFITKGVAKDPMQTLNAIKRIMGFNYPKTGKWGFLLGNKDRFGEVFSNLSKALSAKSGGTLPIISGSGEYLIPFWDVDLKYSFQSGAAWAKKSVEVEEDLLIPADFVIDPQCLSDPRSALTDIFSIRPEKSILSGIKGTETSISGGEGIGRLSRTVAQNSPGARKIVVPLSTEKEAKKLVSEYLAACTSQDSKLKLSNPYVKSLIYIPCDIKGGRVEVPGGFGKLVPGRVKRMEPSQMIII
ncbi:MAG: hypothetical protein FWH45_01215 [Methanomassiliicoccaceae archaeon]|nr:hypothetical protein [Methanomassiliicoccaceae archaeon]MCL2145787.1 hypothetical protein [Methanomassiliicoccaceae archaeon]